MAIYSVDESDLWFLAFSSSAFGVLHVALRVSVMPAPVTFSCDKREVKATGVQCLLGLCRSEKLGMEPRTRRGQFNHTYWSHSRYTAVQQSWLFGAWHSSPRSPHPPRKNVTSNATAVQCFAKYVLRYQIPAKHKKSGIPTVDHHTVQIVTPVRAATFSAETDTTKFEGKMPACQNV